MGPVLWRKIFYQAVWYRYFGWVGDPRSYAVALFDPPHSIDLDIEGGSTS